MNNVKINNDMFLCNLVDRLMATGPSLYQQKLHKEIIYHLDGLLLAIISNIGVKFKAQGFGQNRLKSESIRRFGKFSLTNKHWSISWGSKSDASYKDDRAKEPKHDIILPATSHS